MFVAGFFAERERESVCVCAFFMSFSAFWRDVDLNKSRLYCVQCRGLCTCVLFPSRKRHKTKVYKICRRKTAFKTCVDKEQKKKHNDLFVATKHTRVYTFFCCVIRIEQVNDCAFLTSTTIRAKWKSNTKKKMNNKGGKKVVFLKRNISMSPNRRRRKKQGKTKKTRSVKDINIYKKKKNPKLKSEEALIRGQRQWSQSWKRSEVHHFQQLRRKMENQKKKKKKKKKNRHSIPPKEKKKKKRASLHLRKPRKKKNEFTSHQMWWGRGRGKRKDVHGQAVFCVSVGHSNLLHNNSDNKSAFIHHQRQHSSWTTMVCFQ